MLSSSSSCADYESGFEHGYQHIEARTWLLLGRQDYQRGYEEGQIQAFHDEWYAENADEIVSGLSCPPLLVRQGRLVFIDDHRSVEFE